jgi:hypothetical protein
MKRFMMPFLLACVCFTTFANARDYMVWRVVWPNGSIVEATYRSYDECVSFLHYQPKGSTCVAFKADEN